MYSEQENFRENAYNTSNINEKYKEFHYVKLKISVSYFTYR